MRDGKCQAGGWGKCRAAAPYVLEDRAKLLCQGLRVAIEFCIWARDAAKGGRGRGNRMEPGRRVQRGAGRRGRGVLGSWKSAMGVHVGGCRGNSLALGLRWNKERLFSLIIFRSLRCLLQAKQGCARQALHFCHGLVLTDERSSATEGAGMAQGEAVRRASLLVFGALSPYFLLLRFCIAVLGLASTRLDKIGQFLVSHLCLSVLLLSRPLVILCFPWPADDFQICQHTDLGRYYRSRQKSIFTPAFRANLVITEASRHLPNSEICAHKHPLLLDTRRGDTLTASHAQLELGPPITPQLSPNTLPRTEISRTKPCVNGGLPRRDWSAVTLQDPVGCARSSLVV